MVLLIDLFWGENNEPSEKDIPQWNEFTNGEDGSFEITSCMCDSIDWDGDSVAAGTWTKTDQVNDLWPVYQVTRVLFQEKRFWANYDVNLS